MARIVDPPLDSIPSLRQPLTRGELLVLDLFLKHLPPDWEIYIQPHLNGLRPDFVVLNPRGGIGVFEVKDWDLDRMKYFTHTDGHGQPHLMGHKDGKPFSLQKENPATKVAIYKSEIYNIYCPRLKQKAGWAAITAGVIFPFAERRRVIDLLKPFCGTDDRGLAVHYQPITGATEIAHGQISAVFPEFSRKNSALMSEDMAADLRGWLAEPDFAKTQREPLVLDEEQRELATSRTGSGFRRIKGPAGSGKSLVLAARAAQLANAGKSVLISTYNITLWHYLKDLIVRGVDRPGAMRNIRFTHFHHWCRTACDDVGWRQRYNKIWKDCRHDPDAALSVHLPRLASEAMDQPGAEHYDALLVDEGQDYQLAWWNALKKTRAEGGEAILAADATQNVYGTAKEWTDEAMTGSGFSGRWARLGTNYRLPLGAMIAARSFAETFLANQMPDLPDDTPRVLEVEPCQLTWIQCHHMDAQRVCVESLLNLMPQTGSGGLANADITFLTDEVKFGARVVEDLAQMGIKTVATFSISKDERRREKMGFYMGDARIKATTLHSFKGWEARLLVVHISRADTPESLASVYAALTRVKRSPLGSWLTVVCSAPELANYGREWLRLAR